MGSLETQRRNRRFERSMLRPVGSWAAGVALVFGPSYFIFDQVQIWVLDQSAPTSDAMAPIFPGVVSGLYVVSAALVVALLQLVRRERTEGQMVPAQPGLSDALVGHAAALAADRRYDALVDFRNSVSHILHTGGYNEARSEIGNLALAAAVNLGDYEAQVSVRLDDIGWASHLEGRDRDALVNIDRGIDLCGERIKAGRLLPFSLLLEKGLRHKALIKAAEDLDQSFDLLMQGQAALIAAEDQSELTMRDLRIERAQLEHAAALCIAISYRLHESGKIRRTDHEAQLKMETALEKVRIARKEFAEVGSRSRNVKAMYLESRILDALDREAEKAEVDAQVAGELIATSWETGRGTRHILGG